MNDNMYQPIFILLKHYYDIKTKNQQTYNELLKNINSITESIKDKRNAVALASTQIDEFFRIQKNECTSIIEKRDDLLLSLSNIEKNIQKCNGAFNLFIQKLDSSNASIKYCTNSEILLADIKNTFQLEYRYQAEYVNGEISNIVNEINNVSYKCGQFAKLFSLFDRIIQLYSNRIESSMNYNALAYYDPETKKRVLLNDVIKGILEGREINTNSG